jgi:hypothetical protein
MEDNYDPRVLLENFTTVTIFCRGRGSVDPINNKLSNTYLCSSKYQNCAEYTQRLRKCIQHSLSKNGIVTIITQKLTHTSLSQFLFLLSLRKLLGTIALFLCLICYSLSLQLSSWQYKACSLRCEISRFCCKRSCLLLCLH